MDNKWVYAFAEGDGKNKNLLGGDARAQPAGGRHGPGAGQHGGA